LSHPARGSPAALDAPSRPEALLWAGAALAFSPALVELARHFATDAWARPSLGALYLVGRGAWGSPAASARPGAGLALLAGGLALEGAGIALGPASLVRPGLALGAVGMALFLGRPSLRLALLFLAVVPVPFALQTALDPALRPLLQTPAAALASLLAGPTESVAQGLQQGARFLRVYASDLGLPEAALLAAAAWAVAARRRAPLPRTALVCAAAGAAGLGLQLAGLVLSALVLASAGEEAARSTLGTVPGLLALAAAIGGLELALRRRRAP
jgi:hypothetical protein